MLSLLCFCRCVSFGHIIISRFTDHVQYGLPLLVCSCQYRGAPWDPQILSLPLLCLCCRVSFTVVVPSRIMCRLHLPVWDCGCR